MRYWLTTQWPVHEGHQKPHGVWIRLRHQDVAIKMRRDDLVAVYESRGGPTLIDDDGTRRHCTGGPMAVVYYGRVVKCPTGEDVEQLNYVERAPVDWVYYAELTVLSPPRLLFPREDLCDILGYSTRYYFRGFGTRHSGLRKITETQFAAIQRGFRVKR